MYKACIPYGQIFVKIVFNPPSPPKFANPNIEGEHIVELYFKGQIYEIGLPTHKRCIITATLLINSANTMETYQIEVCLQSYIILQITLWYTHHLN